MATRLPPSRHSSSPTEGARPRGGPPEGARPGACASRKEATPGESGRPLPWWQSGWLWVAIGLLAVTLAAVVVTTLIAMDSPDPAVEIAPGERPAHAREANP
jgi:hypothetical protein